jgi:hypothetical protein
MTTALPTSRSSCLFFPHCLRALKNITETLENLLLKYSSCRQNAGVIPAAANKLPSRDLKL